MPRKIPLAFLFIAVVQVTTARYHHHVTPLGEAIIEQDEEVTRQIIPLDWSSHTHNDLLVLDNERVRIQGDTKKHDHGHGIRGNQDFIKMPARDPRIHSGDHGNRWPHLETWYKPGTSYTYVYRLPSNIDEIIKIIQWGDAKNHDQGHWIKGNEGFVKKPAGDPRIHSGDHGNRWPHLETWYKPGTSSISVDRLPSNKDEIFKIIQSVLTTSEE